jgi:hypothetical protein
MRFKQIEYTLPDFWSGYLINGEPLQEDQDQKELDIWLKEEKIEEGFWDIKTDISGEIEEPSFYKYHDAISVGILACNCYTYVLNKEIKYKEVSNSLKRRFVKDAGLNIDVLQEPHFSLALELYEEDFSAISKYEEFLHTLEVIGNEESFVKESELLTNGLIDRISENEKYKEFNTLKNKEMSEEIQKLKANHKFSKFYHTDNVDKKYLSVDMKQANFNVFKSLGIFDSSYDNYADLIASQTKYKYFAQSKYTRQVIFGHLNPKRARMYMEYTMLKLLDSFSEDIQSKLFAFNTDEIIFQVDSEEEAERITDLLYTDKEFKFVLNGNTFPLNISVFDLYVIKDKKEKTYFYKDYGYKTELKGVPKMFYIQYYKHLNGIKIEDTDLAFYYEGEMAKFINSVFEEK